MADRVDDGAMGIARDHRRGRGFAITDVAGVGMHHDHDASTWLTVRSAVLNGVFSGTRSMPN
jgi:hypothetical protein